MNKLIERAIALKKVYVFENLSAEQLRLVASACEEIGASADEIIFREGESTEKLYLIICGSVKVLKDPGTPRQRTIATLTTGDFFGEMSLFDGEPHSATICSSEECNLLIIRKERLEAIMELYPEIALSIINVFSRRLRSANEHSLKATEAPLV